MADAKAAALENENEADESAEGGEQQAKGKFALPPLKYLIIGGGAFLVLAVGGGGYFFLSPKPAPKPEASVAKAATFLDVPEVLVNLANSGSDRTQYLKIRIVLELSDAKIAEQISPVMPRLMDAFQTYLRELRPTDLDGSAGLYRLKEELTRRVNASIAPNRINAVLFKEIVVQ
jgi:flagellar protein FliL